MNTVHTAQHAAAEITHDKNHCLLTDKDVLGDLVQEMDANKDFVAGDNNYVWFYLIGRYYKPSVIVEMGTRFGYSMKAFVEGARFAGPAHRFELYAIDAEVDGFKPLEVFERYFRDTMGVTDLVVRRERTETIMSLGLDDRADLVMVDAKHTAAGCFWECTIGYRALKPGGVMVVDDIENPHVRDGVEKFCRARGVSWAYLPSLRGVYLVHKPGGHDALGRAA